MMKKQKHLHPVVGHPESRDRGARNATVIMFAVAVLLIAGVGFIYKMTEFAATIAQDEVEGFGAMAIGTYLIGVVPILFLTLWAVFSGKFRDIEAPKFRMLELDREIERGGELRGRDD
jgi:nitrogen fixation-related uncharacterized protein